MCYCCLSERAKKFLSKNLELLNMEENSFLPLNDILTLTLKMKYLSFLVHKCH